MMIYFAVNFVGKIITSEGAELCASNNQSYDETICPFAPVLFKLNIRDSDANELKDCLEIEKERKRIDKNSINSHEETYQQAEKFENPRSDILVVDGLNSEINANMYEEAAKTRIIETPVYTKLYSQFENQDYNDTKIVFLNDSTIHTIDYCIRNCISPWHKIYTEFLDDVKIVISIFLINYSIALYTGNGDVYNYLETLHLGLCEIEEVYKEFKVADHLICSFKDIRDQVSHVKDLSSYDKKCELTTTKVAINVFCDYVGLLFNVKIL
ncbi:hypothetical protein COBT_002871 [Conglomerata obtusa]